MMGLAAEDMALMTPAVAHPSHGDRAIVPESQTGQPAADAASARAAAAAAAAMAAARMAAAAAADARNAQAAETVRAAMFEPAVSPVMATTVAAAARSASGQAPVRASEAGLCGAVPGRRINDGCIWQQPAVGGHVGRGLPPPVAAGARGVCAGGVLPGASRPDSHTSAAAAVSAVLPPTDHTGAIADCGVRGGHHSSPTSRMRTP